MGASARFLILVVLGIAIAWSLPAAPLVPPGALPVGTAEAEGSCVVVDPETGNVTVYPGNCPPG